MKTGKLFHFFKIYRFFSKKKKNLLILLSFIFFALQIFGKTNHIKTDSLSPKEQIYLDIILKNGQRFEIDALVTIDGVAYVNIQELFKKLGIDCEKGTNNRQLKGFIENESTSYAIDAKLKRIRKGDEMINVKNQIVFYENKIYLETNVFGKIFNMYLLFNFRSLSIKLEANFELPILKNARLEKMRNNIKKLQLDVEEAFDTVIGREYHIFKGGVLDWAISSFQVEGFKLNNNFFLGVGSEFLYGETRVSVNYNKNIKFDSRQVYYNWRFINNDHKYLKQVQLGKVATRSIAFLGKPLIGGSFNNSPNTVRKAKGTYILSDVSEPNWTVELYINDILVDYTTTDASGFYLFNVPNVYGYTTLTLKFYGPLGEERVEEKIINTPYTFMPKGVAEYNITGGFLENDNGNSFFRSELNYGVNRGLTIGAGVEYLSNIPDKPFIPFLGIVFQPFSKVILNLKYAQDVNFSGEVNYLFGRNSFLEIEYRNFVKNQKATIDAVNEDLKVGFSLPFKFQNINGNTKIKYRKFVYDEFNFNQLETLISTRYKNNSLNLSLASNWIADQNEFTSSTFVYSRRFKNGIIFRPSVQFNISENNIMRYRAEIEKRASNFTFSASFEKNFQFNSNNINLNIRYDLPFARVGVNPFYDNGKLGIGEDAQGSIAFQAGNGKPVLNYNSAMGKGGIICYPFIDLNQNDIKDKDEPRAYIRNLKISGGKVTSVQKDSTIRITDLNSFIKYKITLDDGELDNIGWSFKHKTYQVLVDPHQFKKLEIPIYVYGEVTGRIFKRNVNENQGINNIRVKIYDQFGYQVAETLSDSYGYYSYLGLKPGEYFIKIDPNSLDKLGYSVKNEQIAVTIKKSINGDLKENLNFEIY